MTSLYDQISDVIPFQSPYDGNISECITRSALRLLISLGLLHTLVEVLVHVCKLIRICS